jgi:hypothetical protein
MMRSVPPRLRSPLIMLVGGAAVGAVGVVAYGWRSLLSLVPLTIVIAVAYYLWGGLGSDSAAMVRQQLDERQAYRQLRIQAVVGRIMSAGAAVAFLAASAAHATLWPFGVFLGLLVVALLAGWAVTRERGDDSHGGPDNWLTPSE